MMRYMTKRIVMKNMTRKIVMKYMKRNRQKLEKNRQVGQTLGELCFGGHYVYHTAHMQYKQHFVNIEI